MMMKMTTTSLIMSNVAVVVTPTSAARVHVAQPDGGVVFGMPPDTITMARSGANELTVTGAVAITGQGTLHTDSLAARTPGATISVDAAIHAAKDVVVGVGGRLSINMATTGAEALNVAGNINVSGTVDGVDLTTLVTSIASCSATVAAAPSAASVSAMQTQVNALPDATDVATLTDSLSSAQSSLAGCASSTTIDPLIAAIAAAQATADAIEAWQNAL